VVTDPRQIKSVKKPLLPSSLRLRAPPLLAVVAVLVLSILVFNQSNLYGWSRQYLIEALSMMNIGVGLDLLLMGSLLALVLMAVITDRSFRLLSFVSKLLLLPTVLGFSELAWLEYLNNGELAIIGTSLPVEVVFLNGLAIVCCDIYVRGYKWLKVKKRDLRTRNPDQEELDRAIARNLNFIGGTVLVSALVTAMVAFIVWTFRPMGAMAMDQMGEVYAVVGFGLVVILMILILADIWGRHAQETVP
jgi:hypothetical protein